MPRKNLAPVGGKPLIWWTIKAALKGDYPRRVIVSTDDEEIAQTASEIGAEVPFIRPTDLAQDDTPGVAPVVHAAQWLEKHESYRSEFVMHLQPTSPLRTSEDIDAVIALALRLEADAVVSVTPAHHHPYWLKQLDQNGRISDFTPLEHPVESRQGLPDLYALNGTIYLARRHVLLKDQSFYKRKTFGYVMPPERSLDIDTKWDLYLADLVLRDQNRVGRD